MIRSVLITAATMTMGAMAAFGQLEYTADWAPNPLPDVDLDATQKTYYINVFDEQPLYGPDYGNANYIDPDAPNGGTYRLAATGTFDSFNPMIQRGQLGAGVSTLAFVRLVDSNSDDVDTTYVVGAEYLQMPQDRSWVLYKFRDDMVWPNGTPITPQDYIWSFQQSLEHSSTTPRYWGPKVMAMRDLGDNRLLVQFNQEQLDRSNPVQIGISRIYPRYWFEEAGTERTLGETFLEPFPGAGAYEITNFKAGRFIEWSLKEDWWGFDVPALKGSYQDKIIYSYYGDRTAQREATKAGEVDLFTENSAKSWAFDWQNSTAIENGHLRKETRPAEGLKSPQMFVLNHRRAPFDNRKVRQALNLTFDFETTNKAVFYDQYTRLHSYFQNSDLQAKGEPTDAEAALLQELFDTHGEEHVPSAVFGPALEQPTTAGDGNVRANLRAALALMAEAGWTLNDDGELVDQNGEQMSFTFIYRSANTGRVVDPWIENLRRIGIDAKGRLMEPNAWWDSYRNHDYDVTMSTAAMNYSGTLMYPTFGSEYRDSPQSRALAGVNNPAIDDIGLRLEAATTREEVNLYARVADRLLQHNHIGVLNWYVAQTRLVWWDKFNEGEYQPQYGSATTGWYIDQAKEEALIGQSGYSLN